MRVHSSQLASIFIVFAVVVASYSVAAAEIDSFRRVIPTPAPDALPEYTIQIDIFDTLTQAVEFGFELPFAENAMGLARDALTTNSPRYVLALGTFYSRAEAEEVLAGLCPPAELEHCRVRALSELESLRGETQVRVASVVAELAPTPQTSLEPELLTPEPALTQRIPLQSEVVVEPANVNLPMSYGSADSRDKKVYTVQIAAMYTREDAKRISDAIPSRFGDADIIAAYSAKGNPVQLVTIGRFAYVVEGRQFADEVCAAINLTDCWVMPLSMLTAAERIDTEVSSVVDLAGRLNAAEPPLVSPTLESTQGVVVQSSLEPIPDKPVAQNDLVYTVQLAAVHDKIDARRLAMRVPADFGEPEIVPVYTPAGDIVNSIIVGRFAFKDEAGAFAEALCEQIGLQGCWVKPLAIVEDTRAVAR